MINYFVKCYNIKKDNEVLYDIIYHEIVRYNTLGLYIFDTKK